MSAPTSHAPNAALLIDFDNVTLGVRSDLTKELRHLLDSDIIKGKVSVQRAYADWRRYPQYIVPLSESSIDLIFAPAFGTNKKNATDIRLAIDATELVFTRPEIGTFILLSGDSDFSSLVIKLKEYGKYVIGVGIRESASDILIQNCDEYFSYTDLAGLTKESDLPSAQRDPWELVVEAVQQMVTNRDVMRADRLKQVMQQIDSNFDEKNAGYNRFSKFVQEAGNRGLITLTKQDNGQFEVAPAPGAGAILSDRSKTGREGSPSLSGTTKSSREGTAADRPRTGREGAAAVAKGSPAERAPAAREGARGRGRGRGRGGDKSVAAASATVEALRTEPVIAPVDVAAEAIEGDKDRGRRRRRGGRGRGRTGEERETTEVTPLRREEHELTLSEAFHLLTRALGELPSPAPHEVLRARMAALHGREDPLLEPVSFVRLLRQANDAEVADVRLVAEGEYEVAMHKTDLAMQVRPMVDSNAADGSAPALPARPAAALRYRSGSQATRRSGQLAMVGVVNLDGDTPPVEATATTPLAETAKTKPTSRGRGKAKGTAATTVPAPKAKAARTSKSAKTAKAATSPKAKAGKSPRAKRSAKATAATKSDAS